MHWMGAAASFGALREHIRMRIFSRCRRENPSSRGALQARLEERKLALQRWRDGGNCRRMVLAPYVKERSGETSTMAEVDIYTTMWCPYCARAKSLLQKKGV